MKFLSCTIAYGMIFPVVLLAQQTPNEGLSLRADGKSASRLLVTNSGRIVAGELLPRPGGYDVILSAGRMFIDSEQVRFLADSPDDAYQKMRESLGELTPDSHLTLARWCLANGQVHNAKREILDALHLDPWRSDAKLMLEKLVRQQQVVVTSGTSNAATIENLSESPSAELNLSDSLLMKPERRSLGGLPADDAKMFTQSVQRILISRCGNARCHGGTSNEMTFRLVPLRNGSSPALAEQNLAAVLNQIDPSAPLQSPLLKACDGLHGGMSQLILQGQTGRIQTETLRTWVQKIASEVAPSGTKATVSRSRPLPSEPVDLTGTEQGIEQASHSIRHMNFDPETYRSSSETDRKHILQAMHATRHDAFDPRIFNRKYHPELFDNRQTTDGGREESRRPRENSF